MCINFDEPENNDTEVSIDNFFNDDFFNDSYFKKGKDNKSKKGKKSIKSEKSRKLNISDNEEFDTGSFILKLK